MKFKAALAVAYLFPGAIASADDPLASLSDEFNNAATLAGWGRVYTTEQWNADQLQHLDINTSRSGWLTMQPYSSTWYQDKRGELTFKDVTGDFAATTYVHSTNRAQTAAPNIDYSLAGILTRTPRAITPATWTAGGENYLFLALGAADVPGTYQFEVKTTVNSVSTLQISTAGTSEAEIQVARVGQYFIMLRRVPPGAWAVHRRYSRPDMLATVQVGMTVYTDWPTAAALTPYNHNSTVITGGNPDLRAEFDYFRFRTPVVPPAYTGADLTNSTLVPDAALLSFLGANAVPVTVSRMEFE